MKILLLSIAIVILGLGVSGQTVERKYDRFTDETTVSILIGQTSMDANFNSMKLTLRTTFTGETAPTDPLCVMSLLITAKEWKMLRADMTMRAIVDGERLTVGIFKRNYSEVVRGAVIEGATMPVTVETLRKLAAGRKVEYQFMGGETVSTGEDQSKYKVFLDALKKP